MGFLRVVRGVVDDVSIRCFFQEAYALMCMLMMCRNSQRVARIGSGGMHSQ